MMSILRQSANTATDFACRAVGRQHVVRASRFVLRRARLDVPNDIFTNGEADLQRWILALSPRGHDIHILDVGANVGRWSRAMLDAAHRAKRTDDIDLHSFEPSSYTFGRLSEALSGQKATLCQEALGASSGRSILHLVAPGAGTNSLHRAIESSVDGGAEEVSTTTLDVYADRVGLDHVTLVKIDTEGNDFAVLCGGQRLFAERRISVAQFEYNHRWIDARHYLRDVFEFMEPFGYSLGKLTPRGVEFYSRWDADLEKYVEGNYIVCTPLVARRLPSLKWWKIETERGS